MPKSIDVNIRKNFPIFEYLFYGYERKEDLLVRFLLKPNEIFVSMKEIKRFSLFNVARPLALGDFRGAY